MKIIYSLTFIICLFTISAKSQINLVPFISNATAVTDITHCNDERLFIVEQAGRIKISDLQGNLNPVLYLNISNKVASGGERGLLGLAFSPNYLVDGRFYVNYTNLSGNSVISRFNVSAGNPDKADSLSEEILFTVTQPFSNHNGGAMFFGKDGYLYISLGDGGSGGDPGNRSQNVMEDLGKLLRINVDVAGGFSIPGSNPYFGASNANPKIWALGLRNAWRVSKDRLTGDIWTADVGQNIWEEVNFQPFSSPGGENYGWRCYEGNVAYNTVGCLPQSSYDAPVYVFAHGPACSVTGGYVYRGAQHSGLFGKYIFTDYCDGIIRTLTPNGSGGFNYSATAPFAAFEFVTFGEDKYGELYVGKTSTGVLKLTFGGCSPVAFIGSQDTITHCGSSYTFSTPYSPGFLYQWYYNGNVIAGQDSSALTATQNGLYQVQVVNSSFCASFSDSIYLDIFSAPDVSIAAIPAVLCVNAATVNLSGLPAGGIFTGAGVTGNIFDPATATPGTHIITYTYDNGNGCIISATATIVVDACLSTPENNTGQGFLISPNPAAELINLVWPSTYQGIKSIEIYDVSGKLCLNSKADENTVNYTMKIDELSSGVYIVKMLNNQIAHYRKLVVR